MVKVREPFRDLVASLPRAGRVALLVLALNSCRPKAGGLVRMLRRKTSSKRNGDPRCNGFQMPFEP